MNPRDPTLPTRAVLQQIIRKYDAVQPFDNDDLHWLVNLAHALNEDKEYNAHQDELEPTEEAKADEQEKEDSINIAPEGDDQPDKVQFTGNNTFTQASDEAEPKNDPVNPEGGTPTLKYRPGSPAVPGDEEPPPS